jgi:hypothetical protein
LVPADHRASNSPLPDRFRFAILDDVTFPLTGNPVEVVLLDGGPMDGRQEPVVSGADELCVVMTDGQRHRYLRTGHLGSLPDGRPAPVFAWVGRTFDSGG